MLLGGLFDHLSALPSSRNTWHGIIMEYAYQVGSQGRPAGIPSHRRNSEEFLRTGSEFRQNSFVPGRNSFTPGFLYSEEFLHTGSEFLQNSEELLCTRSEFCRSTGWPRSKVPGYHLNRFKTLATACKPGGTCPSTVSICNGMTDAAIPATAGLHVLSVLPPGDCQ